MDMNRRTLLGFVVAATVAPGVSFASEEGPVVYRKLVEPTDDGYARARQVDRMFYHEVYVPPLPTAGYVPFTLECAITLIPTEECQAWADRTGGSVTFGFDDETNEIMMSFPGIRSATMFEAEFGPLRRVDDVTMAKAVEWNIAREGKDEFLSSTAKPRIA